MADEFDKVTDGLQDAAADAEAKAADMAADAEAKAADAAQGVSEAAADKVAEVKEGVAAAAPGYQAPPTPTYQAPPPPAYQPGYQAPPAGGKPTHVPSLVLGIIAIIGAFFTVGIVGLVCGIIAVVLAKKNKDAYSTTAGFITGIIGLILGIIILIATIALGAAILGGLGAAGALGQ